MAPARFRLRQTLRNPSVPQVLAVMAVVAAILGAVFGPSAVRRAMESYSELKERRPTFAPPIEVQINPWLQLQARRMMDATRPHEWRAVSFRHGPCHPDNTRQLPNPQFSVAVVEACARLEDIQVRYAGDCATAGECAIPDAARGEIREVVELLNEAFGQAGLVEPYTRTEEEDR